MSNVRKRRTVAFLAGFAFAVACFIAVNAAMGPFSTPEYCGATCHEMGPAYRTWELSPHGANNMGVRADCVDCHLPPKEEYFHHLFAKAYAGGKDIYKHYLGGQYDRDKMSRHVLDRLPNENCMSCHNDLLKKPANAAVHLAHQGLEIQPDAPENRCVRCHETAGHERESKLFSP